MEISFSAGRHCSITSTCQTVVHDHCSVSGSYSTSLRYCPATTYTGWLRRNFHLHAAADALCSRTYQSQSRWRIKTRTRMALGKHRVYSWPWPLGQSTDLLCYFRGSYLDCMGLGKSIEGYSSPPNLLEDPTPSSAG